MAAGKGPDDVGAAADPEDARALLATAPAARAGGVARRSRVARASALGAVCVGAAVLALAGGWRPAPQEADWSEGTGLFAEISPFEAVKESFKPEALKVEGAFTGGTCHMNTSTCPITNMTRDMLTGVFPGGQTRCILGDSPYMFHVIPGDLDKLVLYFQGGGACWDGFTLLSKLCVPHIAYEGEVGIFDRNNSANPFLNYTIIIVGYCSGDAHSGNAEQRWATFPDGRIQQRGFVNAQTVVDWAMANTAPQLKSLILTGSSAGALGTQIWARKLLEDFKYDRAAVISDSYAAVFPTGVQGGLMKGFGICNTGLLSWGPRFLCNTGTVDVQQIFEDAMRRNPKTLFAMVDSKIDFIQMAFYEAVRFRRAQLAQHTSPRKFSSWLTMGYLRYNAYPNWVSFLVNAPQHMYLNNKVLYQTTPLGTNVQEKDGLAGSVVKLSGNTISGDNTPLAEWLRHFPPAPGEKVKSQCAALTPTLPPLPTLPPPSGSFVLDSIRRFKGQMKSTLGTVKGVVTAPLKKEVGSLAAEAGMAYCDLGQANKVFPAFP